MKNKKILYILIPAVIFIWGSLVYKIYLRVNTDHQAASVYSNDIDDLKYNTENDTFSILCNYRDPFLNKQVQATETRVRKVNIPKIKLQSLLLTEKKWPLVLYFGVIKNQQSNRLLALVQINGAGARMKTGDVFAGVELTRVFKDSIEIGFEKEKKMIRKSS